MNEPPLTESAPPPGNPRTLFRLLGLLAVISSLVILALASYATHRVFHRQILQAAETDAIRLSELLLTLEGKNLLTSAGTLTIPTQNLGRFERRIDSFLQSFDIVKIKIYNLDRQIVYSSDTQLIGQVDANNPRLERALAGHNDSRLETKEQVIDLAAETKFDVDVVESYVPIRDDAQQVRGCFEVYVDVTRYRQDLQRGVLASTGSLGLILLVVFGVSLLIVRRATGALHEAQESLRRMASIDPLTGAYNRGEILARARKEASRLRRTTERTPCNAIALIMLDIDRFKRINDRHGQLVGDLVLRQLTRRIKIELRDYDLYGRYGGEEFLAILPATDLSSALSVAERIRKAVGGTPFDVEGQSLPITVSLGVSVICGEALDLTGALKEAEDALTLAKNTGRDRVVTGTSP